MVKIKQWEEDIAKLDTDKINKLIEAIDTLEKWAFFKKEYEELGVFRVSTLLGGELYFREKMGSKR